MYEELVKRLRQYTMGCVAYKLDSDFAAAVQEAADVIEKMSKLADAIPHVCECCVGCELEKKNGGCDNAFILSPKRAMQYLIKPRWIPVEERLPECDLGTEVGNIEWISCGMVHAGCFGRGGKYRDAYFRTWTDAGEGMDAKDADCWRAVTLPEQPKEE